MKNCEYALVVTTDTDFAYAIRRVEDFGCKTGLLAVCSEVPERLRASCDKAKTVKAKILLNSNLAVTIG